MAWTDHLPPAPVVVIWSVVYGITFEQRGVISVKGKGDMTTFFLNGPAPVR